MTSIIIDFGPVEESYAHAAALLNHAAKCRDGGLTELTAKHDFIWNDVSITTVLSVCQVMSNSYELTIGFEYGVEGPNLNFLAIYAELRQALKESLKEQGWLAHTGFMVTDKGAKAQILPRTSS